VTDPALSRGYAAGPAVDALTLGSDASGLTGVRLAAGAAINLDLVLEEAGQVTESVGA
jgi:hypothetical protein